jgi:hypothetical protein
LLSAAIAMVCISFVFAKSALGEAPAKDLWQTYMDAAVASNQTEDFSVEAIMLNAASAFAKKHDPDGQRPALTRLPLMLAYGELVRRDLIKPLSALGMHIDVSYVDKNYNDFIQTINDYASSYYDRWIKHDNDDPRDDFKEEIRFYGMKNSYLIDVALRARLSPDDKIDLAEAISQVGLVYKQGADLECAAYDYVRAFEVFREYQQKLGATDWAAGRFGLAKLTAVGAPQSTLGPAIVDTQVYLVLALAWDMAVLADRTLHPKSGEASSEKPDLAQCDSSGPPAKSPLPRGFDAQVSRASEYHRAAAELAGGLHEYWPDHPLFGLLSYRWAILYGLEFEMSKMHPGEYPDSLVNARNAYEDSLRILTHADGPNSQFLHAIAVDYVDFLVGAKLNDEAKKIGDRYKVVPSAAPK